MLIWTYYNLDIRFRNPHIEPQSISEMLCVPLKISAVVVLDRLSWRCSRLQARRQSLKTSPSSPGQIAKKCTRQANTNVGSRSVRRRRCRCGCGCGCCCCCCCCCCKPLGSGKVRLVQQPFPYLPWHLSAPEQSRSQVREGATRITVFLKLLEVRVVGLRSRQESNSIWVRRNSLVTQSLNHSLHVRVKENFLTRGQ